jgi:hypothetical protein
MAGLPPRYGMQTPTGQATADATRTVHVPIEKQVAQLRQELAALRAQMEAECVRQHWNGEVLFPAAAPVLISVDDAWRPLTISGNGSTITFESGGLTINSNVYLNISSAGAMTLTASMLNGYCGISKFTGVVQCDTMQADAVIAKSYTPGAGNIW